MLPAFLLPETVSRQDGLGPAIPLGDGAGKTLLATLGIIRVLEQESLDFSIWGSADGENWGLQPLVTFPQKFYCGTYSMVLDLTKNTNIRYLQARWKMKRWGRGDPSPMFGLYVFLAQVNVATAVA